MILTCVTQGDSFVRTQVQRLRTVDVYECDGPDCTKICDRNSFSPHWPGDSLNGGCDWIDVGSTKLRDPDVEYRHAHDHPRLYFCSWCCVANWAFVNAYAVDCHARGRDAA
jgi:hypothetical protein